MVLFGAMLDDELDILYSLTIPKDHVIVVSEVTKDNKVKVKIEPAKLVEHKESESIRSVHGCPQTAFQLVGREEVF